uniref:Uncharacterized protein n=1 Tax=Arundo donax TaxID=35708 RepID=A0A0A9AG83_ARUDO
MPQCRPLTAGGSQSTRTLKKRRHGATTAQEPTKHPRSPPPQGHEWRCCPLCRGGRMQHSQSLESL